MQNEAPGTVGHYANVAGNHYDKYHTRNPIARWLMDGFLKSFDELVAASGAKTVYEIGCGEGQLSVRMLRRGLSVRGSDLESSVVEQANELSRSADYGSPFSVRDIYRLDAAEAGADLVVCCEVMEHLPDPVRALEILASCASPYLLVSVPREPIWRVLNMARGKYLTQFGNTPGHIQHWSRSAFIRFIESRFDVQQIRSPLPWTMLLCTVKASQNSDVR